MNIERGRVDVIIMTKTSGPSCKRIMALLVKDGPATTVIE